MNHLHKWDFVKMQHFVRAINYVSICCKLNVSSSFFKFLFSILRAK